MSAWKYTDYTYYSDSTEGMTTVGEYCYSRLVVEHRNGYWYGGIFNALEQRGSDDRPMPEYDLIDAHWLYELYAWKRFDSLDEAADWCEWMDREAGRTYEF